MFSRQSLLPSAAILFFSLTSQLGLAQTATSANLASQTMTACNTTANNKKMITHDVYANWRSIQGDKLSRDGQWAAYALVAQEGDGELVIRHLASGREWRHPRGTAPIFSADAHYVAFAIQPNRAEIDKAKKEKKKGEDLPKPGFGVMDLATGKVETLNRVKRFGFPEEGGNWLAVLLEAPKDEKKDSKNESEKESTTAKPDDIQDGISDQQMAGAGSASASGKKKEAGSELQLWDLTSGKHISYKDVAEFVWAKNGGLLAYSVSVKDAAKTAEKASDKLIEKVTEKSAEKVIEKTNEKIGEKTAEKINQKTDSTIASSTDKIKEAEKSKEASKEGVYLFSTADSSVQSLLTGAGSYKQLRFDDAGTQLAFVSNRDQLLAQRNEKSSEKLIENTTQKEKNKESDKAKDPDPTAFSLFYWHAKDQAASLLANGATLGMPIAWSPSEFGEVAFSKDGARLFFGTTEDPKIEPKDAPEPMKVDLWHWKDPELQSMQKVKAEKEKQRSYRAVVHLADKRFVQLANKTMPVVITNDNAQFALGISDLPYQILQSWDSLYYDAYALDLQTGQSKPLAKKLRFEPALSPAGQYMLAFDAPTSTWFSWSTADGSKTNLTGKLKVHFEDIKQDTPEPRSAYGFAGWTENDASVVVYDQFDLWEINPVTHVSTNLTAGYGRKNHLELRYVSLDKEQKFLPSDQNWVLATTNETDRSSGYVQQNPKGGEPVKLIHANKMISGLLKAKLADTVSFTQQSFEEFPDLWASNLKMQSPQKISNANPQQNQYNWGTQELVSYTTTDGKKLKALLAKPDNFDPKKKYPMMVYIYENMTDNLYRHVPPAPSQNINVTRYVSNGYIVLRPDIVYTTGYPGKSAMNTVLPAIQQVIAKGYVDPQRVGIQGHSWGAYQINYLLTHTNIFRAAEAGASMANMISGYGGIRWGTGMSRAFQYERGQSRIGGTPWGDQAKYIENSPIFKVDKVQTPYLTIHNDEDDAVPYYQAIEFFTALRHLGKEAYWFNYNGEKHGLRERDNIKHYTVHMAEFFDHYLLGSPRPEWMDKPVPYLERGKRDVMGLFKTAEQKEQEAKADADAKVKTAKKEAALN